MLAAWVAHTAQSLQGCTLWLNATTATACLRATNGVTETLTGTWRSTSSGFILQMRATIEDWPVSFDAIGVEDGDDQWSLAGIWAGGETAVPLVGVEQELRQIRVHPPPMPVQASREPEPEVPNPDGLLNLLQPVFNVVLEPQLPMGVDGQRRPNAPLSGRLIVNPVAHPGTLAIGLYSWEADRFGALWWDAEGLEFKEGGCGELTISGPAVKTAHLDLQRDGYELSVREQIQQAAHVRYELSNALPRDFEPTGAMRGFADGLQFEEGAEADEPTISEPVSNNAPPVQLRNDEGLAVDPARASRRWFDGAAWREGISLVAYLRYDPMTGGLAGQVHVTDVTGHVVKYDVSGVVGGFAVEQLRRRLGSPTLAGRWQSLLGPALCLDFDESIARSSGDPPSTVWQPGLAGEDNALVRVVVDEGGGSALARLVPEVGLVLAIVAFGGHRPSITVLAEDDDAIWSELVRDLANFGEEEKAALRQLAIDLVVAGNYVAARHCLRRAVELYLDGLGDSDAIKREGDLISCLLPLMFDLRTALALRDHDQLLDTLELQVQLQSRILFEDSTATVSASAGRVREAAAAAAEDVGWVSSALTNADPSTTDVSDVLAEVRTGVTAIQSLIGDVNVIADRAPPDSDSTRAILVGLVDDAARQLRSQSSRVLMLATSSVLEPLLVERKGLISQIASSSTWLSHDYEQFEQRDEAFLEALRSAPVTQAEAHRFFCTYQSAAQLAGAAERLTIAARHEKRLAELDRQRSRTESTGRLAQNLGSHLEQFRRLLAGELERIDAVDAAGPFYRHLVRLLLRIDAPAEALCASELARARAFADVLSGGPARPLGPSELLQAIADLGETVVQYELGDDEVVVWVVKPSKQVGCWRTPTSELELRQDIGKLHELVSGEVDVMKEVEIAAVLRRLAMVLWDPIPEGWLPEDPDEPVVVIPHGPLTLVPMSALIDREGMYLVHRHAFVVAPSVGVLDELRSRSRYSSSPGSMTPWVSVLVDPAPMPNPSLPALPQALAAIPMLTEFFDPAQVRMHVGPDAHLDAYRSLAGRPGVLLLITHAVAFSGSPARGFESYIALAPTDQHDGHLRAAELQRIAIAADTVVLLACSTAAGHVSGDGVIGIARALLQAGAQRLVSTLGNVLEERSVELLWRTLHAWSVEGAALPAALRRAQASLSDEYGHQIAVWGLHVLFGQPNDR